MNSIHRIGVALAGLATVATVGGAVVAQGYLAAQDEAARNAAAANAMVNVDPTADPTTEATPDPTVSLDPETIYINPMPTPPVIKITAPPVKKPPVVHVVTPARTPPPLWQGDDGGSDD